MHFINLLLTAAGTLPAVLAHGTPLGESDDALEKRQDDDTIAAETEGIPGNYVHSYGDRGGFIIDGDHLCMDQMLYNIRMPGDLETPVNRTMGQYSRAWKPEGPAAWKAEAVASWQRLADDFEPLFALYNASAVSIGRLNAGMGRRWEGDRPPLWFRIGVWLGLGIIGLVISVSFGLINMRVTTGERLRFLNPDANAWQVIPAALGTVLLIVFIQQVMDFISYSLTTENWSFPDFFSTTAEQRAVRIAMDRAGTQLQNAINAQRRINQQTNARLRSQRNNARAQLQDLNQRLAQGAQGLAQGVVQGIGNRQGQPRFRRRNRPQNQPPQQEPQLPEDAQATALLNQAIQARVDQEQGVPVIKIEGSSSDPNPKRRDLTTVDQGEAPIPYDLTNALIFNQQLPDVEEVSLFYADNTPPPESQMAVDYEFTDTGYDPADFAYGPWWEDQAFETLFNMSSEIFVSWIQVLPYISLPGLGIETDSLLASQANDTTTKCLLDVA